MSIDTFIVAQFSLTIHRSTCLMTVSVVEKKPNKALNILPKTWVKRWTEHSNVQLSEEDVDYIVTNTAISREQIEKQFEVFITNHPDGRISKKSFRNTANIYIFLSNSVIKGNLTVKCIYSLRSDRAI